MADSNEAVQEQVLRALVQSAVPLCALDLSRRFRREKSTINKCLYGLLKRGKAYVDTTQVKCPPMWSAQVASIANSYQEEEEKLLATLKESVHGVTTFSLALTLQKSETLVNQMLYPLLDIGMVEKIHDKPPAWKIRATNTATTSTLGTATIAAAPNPRKRQAFGSKDVETKAHTPKKQHLDTSSKPLSADTRDHHSEDSSACNERWAKTCSDMVWNKYKQIHATATDKDIVAAFFLRDADDIKNGTGRLLALGSGTSIAGGESYSLLGNTVHDCHAEIIARRGLLRWLYGQLDKADKGESDSYAIVCEKQGDDPLMGERSYTLKPFQLWLYISQAPCGDGAVFSRPDIANNKTTISQQPKTASHFRMKTEAGTGSIPSSGKQITGHEVTFDGLQRGDRALCHSCSDKIAKWNILGVQGALLSRLIPPLYVSGMVVGDVFHREHLRRAVCCRSEVALRQCDLPAPFALHHPKLLPSNRNTPRHEKLKGGNHVSVNWTELDGDEKVELVNSQSGLIHESQEPSRLCKHSLLLMFQGHVASKYGKLSYGENKYLAEGYQAAKQRWLRAMELQNYGRWLHKPTEVDDFVCRSIL